LTQCVERSGACNVCVTSWAPALTAWGQGRPRDQSVWCSLVVDLAVLAGMSSVPAVHAVPGTTVIPGLPRGPRRRHVVPVTCAILTVQLSSVPAVPDVLTIPIVAAIVAVLVRHRCPAVVVHPRRRGPHCRPRPHRLCHPGAWSTASVPSSPSAWSRSWSSLPSPPFSPSMQSWRLARST